MMNWQAPDVLTLQGFKSGENTKNDMIDLNSGIIGWQKKGLPLA